MFFHFSSVFAPCPWASPHSLWLWVDGAARQSSIRADDVSLLMCKYEKSVGLILSLVLRIEALALPISPNEQRRSPRQYVYRAFGIPYI